MTDLRTQLQTALAASYTFERELGRGGMATVFLAQDLRHERPVAFKVLHPDLAHALGPERFQREIRLAARLQHPHILTVHDSGEAAGQLWFTMPFVEGESLRDRLRRERQLSVDDAIRVAREAAQALQYAHEHGVVHRDIKPENLLLTRDGNTLVADFGIARALGAAENDEKLTNTGLVVGTPAYMSPEQAAGDKTLDARTDVYSLASVLYELLVGEPPFAAPTMQGMMVKRLTEPPPSARVNRPSVPESVDLAIRKALAPVAADRFASAAEFSRALMPAGATMPIAAALPAPAPVATTVSRRAPEHRYRAVAVLAIGFLLGIGVLFAWRRGHPEAAPGGDERRIAVLPFQNLGDSADAYFADGITDAVRGKLTALPSMRVTGSNSSAQYRGTTKTPREIGRELGVDYLLVGKVRWAKRKDGASRVQVSPELIDVATADAKWQQPFDASLTDVFQVQADIAGRVAQALDVAIGARQQQVLENRPTRNLAAYDAYLKGQAQRALGNAPAALREAGKYFEQAVALDSGFVAAWAALSFANSLLYSNATPSPRVADRARSAAERALALDSQTPLGYWALGSYHRLVTSAHARAAEQYTKGLALAPNDVELLRSVGLSEQELGRWEDAVEHFQRGRSLDPRSAALTNVLGWALLWLRRYDEAMEAADAAAALQPSNLSLIETKSMVRLARGDLAAARAVLVQPPADVDLPTFAAYVATYWDLYWVLDDEQRALLKRLTPASFDGDAGSWGLALAGAYEVEGNRRRAAAYGDSARAAFEQQLYAAPENAQLHVLLGVALAYAGRKDAAIREGERAVAQESSQTQQGKYFQHQLARIYILTGEPEKALDRLEPLLQKPYYLSPGWLSIDPTFAPLRGNPRFERLISGG